MTNSKGDSRRQFLKQSTLGLGAGLTGISHSDREKNLVAPAAKLPREITVVGVDLLGLWPEKTTASRLKRMEERMEDVAGLQPDVVVLPELFDSM